MTKANYGKLAGLGLATTYFVAVGLQPEHWHIIDGANLIFHEAGHAIFSFFGPHWVEIAGGSVFQTLLPFSLALIAWRQERPLTVALLLLWTGQTLINTSVYAGDALKQQLPLIADNAIHDWNHLLWHFGLLKHTALIASLIRGWGWLTMLLGLAYGLWFTRDWEPDPETPSADSADPEKQADPA
jgi:hypothetical protein